MVPDFVCASSEIGLVSCDWFSLSVKTAVPYDGRPLSVPSGWSAVEVGGTAVYSHRWYIMDVEGGKVGTLLLSPKSPAIPACSGLLEVANYYLYSDKFHDVLAVLLDVLPLAVSGVNRCDLCCDFMMDRQRWLVYRYLEDGQAYLKGIRRSNIWRSVDKGAAYPHQMSWGGRESAFHWKVYYKYKELYEGGGGCTKPYIEDLWRAAGMVPKSVWRCEVSVTSTNSLKSEETGRPMGFMEWYDRRVELFQRIYADKFVVRMDEGHADRRQDPALHFLGFAGGKLLKHRNSSGCERVSDPERRLACKMWSEYNDVEVQADRFAADGVREFLRYICQKQSNVAAIQRRFNVSEQQILHAICEAQ